MIFNRPEELDISVILPCLNEELTVALCIRKALSCFEKLALKGEVIVIDNGSSDCSFSEALNAGAEVIREPIRGYGRAIRRGMEMSRGRILIIADADNTYDLSELGKMVRPLLDNAFDVMIGDRYSGVIERGAMKLSHRIGGAFLAWLARKRFLSDVNDFHCGLRGITRQAASSMEITSDGMELATEFVAEASLKKLRIGQVPVSLGCGARGRKSKLRTVRDGFRHLRYIMNSAPGQ
ncbi:MAG: glycosyltransferase family 2 protein [Lachnospiraceae bacterium]|nr:glycosyltransferase family 2 protein [Lachnospiraceae bacterium]